MNTASRLRTLLFSTRAPGTAVLLDVDGTLVDSNDAHARAWVDAFAEAGITVAYDDVRRAIGMGGDKLMPRVSGIDEDSPEGERLSERRRDIFASRYLPQLRGFPRVRDLIERLRQDGHTLVIATSAQEAEVEPLLQAAGIADIVKARTSSGDAEESKPDPDILQAALKRSGASPEYAVMLGDTPYDIEAAHRAGIMVVAVECGGWSRDDLRGAAEVYESPADLLERYDTSFFARLAARRGYAASGQAARAGALHPSIWLLAGSLMGLVVYALLRATAPAPGLREPGSQPRSCAGLGPRERADLREIIMRTS